MQVPAQARCRYLHRLHCSQDHAPHDADPVLSTYHKTVVGTALVGCGSGELPLRPTNHTRQRPWCLTWKPHGSAILKGHMTKASICPPHLAFCDMRHLTQHQSGSRYNLLSMFYEPQVPSRPFSIVFILIQALPPLP